MSLLQEKKDVRLQIAEFLKDKGITQSHICKKLDISGGHLGEVLKRRRKLSESLLKRINDLLESNFEMTPQEVQADLRG